MIPLGKLQKQVLETIADKLVSGNEIARAIGRQKSTATYSRPLHNVDACLLRLFRSGLVERKWSGVVYGYMLTDAGREALKGVPDESL